MLSIPGLCGSQGLRFAKMLTPLSTLQLVALMQQGGGFGVSSPRPAVIGAMGAMAGQVQICRLAFRGLPSRR